MKTGLKPAVLEGLRARIQGLERLGNSPGRAVSAVLPFGVSVLDAALPEGGLARAALHEMGGDDAAGFAAATAFAASVTARLPRTILWCSADKAFYPPGCAGLGLHPSRLIVVTATTDADMLCVMEEGLRHHALGGVIGEIDHLDLTASRRLQLASEKSGVMGLVLRRPSARRDRNPIAAASRWHVRPTPSAPHFIPQAGRARWELTLTHARHGQTGCWTVEAPDAQGYLYLSSAMADRGALAPFDGCRRLAG